MAVKTKPTKAIVGSIVAGVSAFFTPVLSAVINGADVTPGVWATGALAALAFAGVVFPSVYLPTNEPIDG